MCLFVFLVFVWLWVISFVSTCLWGYIVNEFVCGWEGASTIAPMSNCPIILNRAILINFDLASGFAIALDHQSFVNSQNAGHDLELFCNAVEIAVKFIIYSIAWMWRAFKNQGTKVCPEDFMIQITRLCCLMLVLPKSAMNKSWTAVKNFWTPRLKISLNHPPPVCLVFIYPKLHAWALARAVQSILQKKRSGVSLCTSEGLNESDMISHNVVL